MEYSPPPFFKRGPSLLTRFTFFSILSVVLLVADARFNYLVVLRQGIAGVVYPLQRLSSVPSAVATRIGEFFVTQSQLQRDNDQLRRQELLDTAALQVGKSLESENQHLRQLLGLRERLPRDFIAAEILYSNRDPFTRRVVVDRGFQHGVKAGQAVVDEAGVVGQVTRVFPWVSEVTLVTDKEQAIPIQSVRSGLRGVTFGIGYDGTLELRFMPVNADIQNGDLLVTSGIDGTYPPGLPVAVVSNIERNAAYAFARITCTPAASVTSFGQVLIVSTADRLPENPVTDEEPGPKAKRAKK
ncbi:MAG TPA: rod shape-determining protein MreC [Burkholderiales bacterium]|nr:rod shape-determining protein MreC [Burkholderiales bacterium]